MNTNNSTAWYKNRWAWFVISFPLLTIVAGVLTYLIAAKSPHTLVKDDYFKQGLAINQSLAKQAFAKKYAIKATINIEQESQLLLLRLNHLDSLPASAISEELLLIFSHPTLSKYDRTISFSQLSENEYVAKLPEIPQAHWYVRLKNKTEQWLIKSRWHYPESLTITIDALTAN